MRPSVTPSSPLRDRGDVRLDSVSKSEWFCCSEIGRCDQTEFIRRSPAPLFSSANSQFFRALSYECLTKPPGSAPFPWVFRLRIETVVQGQLIPLFEHHDGNPIVRCERICLWIAPRCGHMWTSRPRHVRPTPRSLHRSRNVPHGQCQGAFTHDSGLDGEPTAVSKIGNRYLTPFPTPPRSRSSAPPRGSSLR